MYLNNDIVKFNTGIYGGDQIKTDSVIKNLKEGVSDLIGTTINSDEFKHNKIDQKEIEGQILSKVYDLELKAKFVEYFFNHPSLDFSRVNISPIVSIYSGPKESDLTIVNDEYINAGWGKNGVIKSKNSSAYGQKASAESCRILSQEKGLYDEIFDEENASKARLKAHEKSNTEAIDDVYEKKNTGRHIKYHRFLDQDYKGTVRIGEDVSENPFFKNYINQNIGHIPLNFTKDIIDILQLILMKDTPSKDCKQNLVSSIKKLRNISTIGDMLYNGPFLVSAILNFNEKECTDKLVLANKAFVGTTEYPLEELIRLYKEGLYNNTLYSNIDQKKYIEEMMVQLKNNGHYNESFTMETMSGLLKNIGWDTYFVNIGGKKGSIRIGSIIKE